MKSTRKLLVCGAIMASTLLASTATLAQTSEYSSVEVNAFAKTWIALTDGSDSPYQYGLSQEEFEAMDSDGRNSEALQEQINSVIRSLKSGS